jgi:hypothetical protein
VLERLRLCGWRVVVSPARRGQPFDFHWLTAWLMKNPPTRLVFPADEDKVEEHFLRICKAVALRSGQDPSNFWLHKFRDTFAAWVLRRGDITPWHNPLLWSHYADRHRGMALGFDTDDAILKSECNGDSFKAITF